MAKVNFWCDRCKEDYELEAQKEKHGEEEIWVAYCPKGKGDCYNNKLIRLITNPEKDRYFWDSRKLKEMRAKYWKDILQPGQEGYKTYYGDPDKELNDKLYKQEKENWERKRNN